MARGDQAAGELLDVVSAVDFGEKIPFDRVSFEGIQDDISAITIEEAGSSRHRGRRTRLDRRAQAPAEQLADRGRFPRAGRADELEMLGFVGEGIGTPANVKEPVPAPSTASRAAARGRIPKDRAPLVSLRRTATQRPRNVHKASVSRLRNIPFHHRTAVPRHQLMVSVPFDDVIIGFVAVARSTAIDPHTQPRRIAAMTPVNPAAALFETTDARGKPIAFGPQRGDFARRGQQPSAQRRLEWPCRERRNDGPKESANVGGAFHALQRLRSTLALRRQSLELFDERSPYFLAHDAIQVPRMRPELFQMGIRQFLMGLGALHQ